MMLCHLGLLILTALKKIGKNALEWKRRVFLRCSCGSWHMCMLSLRFRTRLYWKALNGAPAVSKAVNQRSYIQLGFWEIVIAKLIFRRRTRQFWEFLCSNLSRSCCRQQSQSCRVVVGTAFLAGNLTRSSTEFRKILIRVNCDLPWVQALPCFCTVSLFGLQD